MCDFWVLELLVEFNYMGFCYTVGGLIHIAFSLDSVLHFNLGEFCLIILFAVELSYILLCWPILVS